MEQDRTFICPEYNHQFTFRMSDYINHRIEFGFFGARK